MYPAFFRTEPASCGSVPWSGLYRYDGYNFISYKHDPDDTSSIADNSLFTLYEDKVGVLWIGSLLGLEKFDHASGAFRHYTPNPSATGSDGSNNVYLSLKAKTVDYGSAQEIGLCRFNRASGEFTYLRQDSTDPASEFTGTICEDREGSLWFGTATGLAKYDFSGREVQILLE